MLALGQKRHMHGTEKGSGQKAFAEAFEGRTVQATAPEARRMGPCCHSPRALCGCAPQGYRNRSRKRKYSGMDKLLFLEIILGPGLVGQEVGLKLPDRVAFAGPLSQRGRAHRLSAQTSMGRAKVAKGWRKWWRKQRNTRLAGPSIS